MTREEAINLLADMDSDKYTAKEAVALTMAIKALEYPEKNVIAVVPCGDAISRQAVIDAMYELCSTGETLKENPWRDNPHIDAVVEAIEELPSVSPKQRTGRWKRISIDKYSEHAQYWYRCDKCGKDNLGNTNFCPNCGCKMQEVKE